MLRRPLHRECAAPSAEDQYKLQREGMVAGGMPVTREEARTVGNTPSRDFLGVG
jgi:hypothetical protein